MVTILNEKSINAIENLPLNSNLINISSFRQLDAKVSFRSFSIKYVVDGCESYTVNGNKYAIEKGQYLLANSTCEGAVIIDSRHMVTGICIDIDPLLLSEIASSHIRADTPYPDVRLGHFFHTSDFLENKYRHSETLLGKSLVQLSWSLQPENSKKGDLSKELFYELAEKIVLDHIKIYRQLQNVPGVKSSTKKELLRRLEKGKSFLDARFRQSVTIDEAAREATLSEYYFFRLFKSVYGITPYNYLMKKRLHLAKSLIKVEKASVTEAALETGFADVFCFSKAFKKAFGHSPSALNK